MRQGYRFEVPARYSVSYRTEMLRPDGIDGLASLVEEALSLADALALSDVAISLDGARTRLADIAAAISRGRRRRHTPDRLRTARYAIIVER